MFRLSSCRLLRALPFLVAAPLAAQDWIDAPRVVLPEGAGAIRGVGDFDGDGDADLLVAQVSSLTSSILSVRPYFQVPGGFEPGLLTTLPVDPNVLNGQVYLEVGDLTGDGLPDVVMEANGISGQPDGFRLLINTADGSFAQVHVEISSQPVSFAGALGDADANGGLELAVVMRVLPSGPTTLGWWRWNSELGTLVARPSTEVTGSVAAVPIDLDGDGRSEVLVARAAGAYDLYATLPGGQPALASTVQVAESSGTPHVGDIDGDGDQDLLVAWRQGFLLGDELRLGLALNEGGVLVQQPAKYLYVGDDAIASTCRGHLVDWDMDGDLDFLLQIYALVLVENDGGDFVLSDVMSTVRDNPYDFVPPVPGAGVADLTGDGLPDLAGGTFLYAGTGRFEEAAFPPRVSGSFDIQDFDGDGDLDVIVRPLDAPELLQNDGSGRFGTRTLAPPTPAGLLSRDSVPVDLDGDGVPDLLRVLREDEYPFLTVVETRFLRGTGVGTFVDAHAASAPGVAIDPALTSPAADLDDDGDADVLAFDGYWDNDGTAVFPTRHLAWDETPTHCADLDGDGDLDILARTYAGDLSLVRNGGGVFSSELLASLTDTEPALRDFDHDGDLDLGVGTRGGGRAVLLLENVDGAFPSSIRLENEQAVAQRVALDDFDGDGQTDVIAMPAGFTTLIEWHLWRQSAAWVFEPPVVFLGNHAFQIADFDSDGDLDFLGRRLVRSRRFDGPAGGSLRQHGVGWAGPEPAAPLLGAVGPLRPGSATAALRLRRARGDSAGVLLLSNRAFDPGPAGKARLSWPPHVPVLAFTTGDVPGAGEGRFDLALGPQTIALQGQRIWMQAVIATPGQSLRSASITNALELVFGE